jgi:signal transduction histidine kinase
MQVQNYEIVTAVVVTTIVFLLSGFFILVLVAYFYKRKSRLLAEQEEMKLRFNEELLHTQLEIQEYTFRSISEEIHDNIGQVLSFVKLSLHHIATGMEGAAREDLLEARNQLGTAIQDLRDLSRTLNTHFISDHGLEKAIKQQLLFLERTGYSVNLQLSGNSYVLPVQQGLVLFRVVQELLNNIVRHADASHISVDLHYGVETILLTVKDNGKGFNAQALETEGLGIRNMRSRLAVIQGQLVINSNAGDGSVVSILLPKQ